MRRQVLSLLLAACMAFMFQATAFANAADVQADDTMESVSDLQDTMESRDAATPIKIACVGDSITAGARADPISTMSYPAQLQGLLGDGYIVENYGFSGRTMNDQSEYKYIGTKPYNNSISANPDIVIIMLGTNDSKDGCWEGVERFKSSARTLIRSYQALSSQPKIYFATSPALAPESNFVGTPQNEIIRNERIANVIAPVQRELAAEFGCELIDINEKTTALANAGKLGDFLSPDNIHPDNEGYALLAGYMFDGLMTQRYNITVTPMEHGTVTASSATAKEGDRITLTVVPESGYRLASKSLKVNDSAISGYSFIMPKGDVTVSATFSKLPGTRYAITVSPTEHGTVTASATSSEAGETITLTATPDDGYRLAFESLKANGTIVNDGTFVMPSQAVTITAKFEEIPATRYAITINPMVNGSVTADVSTAAVGETVTLTISPNEGYQVAFGGPKVNGASISGNTFVMPESDVIITAIFEELPITRYAVYISPMQNGKVTSMPAFGMEGETVFLTVTPDEGYQLVDGSLAVDGIAIPHFSFVMPARVAVVFAEFEKIPVQYHTVTVLPTRYGSVVATPKTASMGEIVTLAVLPEEGYQLVAGSLKMNGASIVGDFFVMPGEDVVISAEFEPVPIAHYTITVELLDHGAVTTAQTQAAAGEPITLTVIPEEGYHLIAGSLKANGIELWKNKFLMPAADVVITASFEENANTRYPVVTYPVNNGTILVDKVEAAPGDVVSITLIPSPGYRPVAGSVRVNGIVVFGGSFYMPEKGVVVFAEFEQIPGRGCMISGQVRSYNPSIKTLLSLYAPTDTQHTTALYTTTIEPQTGNGQQTQAFSLPGVAFGTYDLVVTKAGHLPYTITGIVVDGADLDLTVSSKAFISTMTMIDGDINGDGRVNISDINIIANGTNNNQNVPANPLTDINGDGRVNISDVNIIYNAASLNKTAADTAFTY